MFDPNRLKERVENIKTNLRNFSGTRCAGPEDLLRRDDLLDLCVLPSLEAYDEELGAMYQQYKEAQDRAVK